MSTPEDVAARLRQLEPTVRYFCSETDADLMVELGNLITDQRATIERLERQMLEWRICAQEITPGGSEFMTPEAVRHYQRDLKNRYHAAKCEVAILRKERALSATREEPNGK